MIRADCIVTRARQTGPGRAERRVYCMPRTATFCHLRRYERKPTLMPAMADGFRSPSWTPVCPPFRSLAAICVQNGGDRRNRLWDPYALAGAAAFARRMSTPDVRPGTPDAPRAQNGRTPM